TRTIVVLGGAYGGRSHTFCPLAEIDADSMSGARTAQVLAADAPKGWRIMLIDRNSHVNHIYVMPRFAVLPGHEYKAYIYVMPCFAVLPGHEYKAFVPFTSIFHKDPTSIAHLHLQAHILSLTRNTVTLNESFPNYGLHSPTIKFDYAIYALGSHLPAPLDLWGTPAYPDNKNNIHYHEFATDIAAIYPNKKVTLLHSRDRFLPRFDEAMHFEVLRSLKDENIEVILGERLNLDSIKNGQGIVNTTTGRKVVRTVKGREIEADLLLLCTGQKPNTQITVNPENSLAQVIRTLQIGVLPSSQMISKAEKSAVRDTLGDETTPYPNIFVIGDSADAFGAIAAGHNAYYQGEVAAQNIIRLIKRSESSPSEKVQEAFEPLEHYTPRPPAIKVSLGLTKSVYQSAGVIGTKNDWPLFGIKVIRDEDMIP
ncbi:Apoptosis-inducing factor 2, partial [Leucoagaricus sp. SymC.cos]